MPNLQLSLLGWKSHQIPYSQYTCQLWRLPGQRQEQWSSSWWTGDFFVETDTLTSCWISFIGTHLSQGQTVQEAKMNILYVDYALHFGFLPFSVSSDNYWSNMIIFDSFKNCLIISSFVTAIDHKSIQFALVCLTLRYLSPNSLCKIHTSKSSSTQFKTKRVVQG